LEPRRCFIAIAFNVDLEYAIRRVRANQEGLKLNGKHHYAGGVYILVGSILTIKKNTEASVKATKEIELEVNAVQT
jgi:hypothetical protein